MQVTLNKAIQLKNLLESEMKKIVSDFISTYTGSIYVDINNETKNTFMRKLTTREEAVVDFVNDIQALIVAIYILRDEIYKVNADYEIYKVVSDLASANDLLKTLTSVLKPFSAVNTEEVESILVKFELAEMNRNENVQSSYGSSYADSIKPFTYAVRENYLEYEKNLKKSIRDLEEKRNELNYKSTLVLDEKVKTQLEKYSLI